ncbi:MAG: hypothetical protein CMJ83_13035 [Planctomycetes bacterium]|nr:hypothetical protein [Planctomycetota bacterium]
MRYLVLVLFSGSMLVGCVQSELRTVEGIGVKNLRQPADGLYTGGQILEEQMQSLAKAGCTNLICLRPADESGTGWEEAKAREAGVNFVRIPVKGREGQSRENGLELRKAMAASEDGTTLVYCGSGNRVGTLLALNAHWFEGMSKAEALAFGKTAGVTKMEPILRDVLEMR